MKIFFTVLLFLFSNSNFAQDAVKWSFGFNSEANTIELKVNLAEGWHIYSQKSELVIGPVPTSITFNENQNIKLIGKVEEPNPIKDYDENFEDTLAFFEKEVVFSQKVEFRGNHSIEGVVNYMICNSSMCLPPKDELFKIELKK